MTDCIFCKIVRGEIPSRQVFENEHVLAFHDIQPAAPVHVLIIPKKHIASANEMQPEDREVLGEVLLAAPAIARELGVAEGGYRLINNCGPDGGQVVYHLHVHLLGGEKLGGLNVKHP
ncbi:histidine triad nucleotide-binding protein [Paenibacillus sp. HJGM_3]|uniref:histidine triad nucleotide-binding protein n=1 Tax=Paenibacillus sp. HJGM_3 TaxID=3379816 RepID=UPI00385C0D3B